jgi:hypothetical protein
MKKIFGFVLIFLAVIFLGYFFLAPPSSEERAIMARQADYGGVGALTSKPRSIYLYGGVALGILGGALLKKS